MTNPNEQNRPWSDPVSEQGSPTSWTPIIDNEPSKSWAPSAITAEQTDDQRPPILNSNFVTIAKDSNHVLFFGTGMSGKSVILSSMLYYMRARAGVLRPNPELPNNREAEVLLYDFFNEFAQGILPSRTVRDQVTRLNLIFEPNNRSKKVQPINLTFLETSGENHAEIARGGVYHGSIKSYLKPDIPLSVIIVTSYDRAHQEDTLINTFLGELIKNGRDLRRMNIMFVVSKWDLSGRIRVEDEEELNQFISTRLPMSWNSIQSHRLETSYYTVGLFSDDNGVQRISGISLHTAEILTRWLYESITGYEIDYPGTWWEQLKWSLGFGRDEH